MTQGRLLSCSIHALNVRCTTVPVGKMNLTFAAKEVFYCGERANFGYVSNICARRYVAQHGVHSLFAIRCLPIRLIDSFKVRVWLLHGKLLLLSCDAFCKVPSPLAAAHFAFARFSTFDAFVRKTPPRHHVTCPVKHEHHEGMDQKRVFEKYQELLQNIEAA